MFTLNGKGRKAVEILKQYGLQKYESKTYITLLLHGEGKAGDIAEKSEVPHSKVYYALQSLQRKRLVEKTQRFPAKFVALPFELYLTGYLQNKTQEMEQLRKNRVEFRQIICSLQPVVMKYQEWE